MTLDTGEPLWGEVCARWLADRTQHVLPRTLTAYEKSARLTLVPELGGLVVGAVTRQLVRAMHARARDQRGPAAANQALQHGRMAWRFAADESLVAGANPFERIQLWAEARRAHPLSAESLRAVWQVCEDVLTGTAAEPVCSRVHAAYFQLVLLTGLRKREATHLRHDEFDRARGVLVIATHKTSRSSGAKEIALNRAAAEHLERLQDVHCFDERFFFPSARSRRGHIEDPLSTWNRVRDAAGVAVGNLHDARRGFATILHSQGVDLRQLQDLLGHRSMATTAKYVRPTTSTSRTASDKLLAPVFGACVPTPTTKEVGRG